MMKFVIVLVGVLIGLHSYFLCEIPITGEETSVLDEGYSYEPLKAPILTGNLLHVVSWLISESPLRYLLARILLNDNKIHLVRSFASHFPHLPPMYYPIDRVSAETWNTHQKGADEWPLKQLVKIGVTSKRSNAFYTVMDYHRVYEAGLAIPSAVMAGVVRASKELQPQLKMFSSFMEEDVMVQARLSDARWAAGKPLSVLDGVPVAFKDMINVKGHLIYDGGLDGSRSEVDDTIVERFRAAGAIVLGVTVMTEGGVSPLGYSAHFKGPFNPYSLEHYTGGSSSGSASVVASGIAPIAIGFDGGGSIRIPASMSGLVGIACTGGRIPFEFEGPVISVVKAGPIAATTDDALIGYAVMAAQPQPDHFYSQLYGAGGPPPARVDGYVDGVKGMRVGVYWDYVMDSDTVISHHYLKTLDILKSKGAVVVNITIPHLKVISLSHAMKIMSEFSLCFDKKFYSSNLEPNTKITVLLGKTLTANEVIAADRVRRYAFDMMKGLFKDHQLDLILTPTIPLKVPRLPAHSEDSGENNNPLVYQLLKYIFMANLIGVPAMSVPIGYDEDGMPIGLQLLGDHWNEHKLFRAARTIETEFTERKRPPIFFDALGEFTINL